MSFADNSSTNSTELLDELLVHPVETFEYIITFFSSFPVFIFPFYAYLNIVNRPQDSQRAVFPFLNFFFKVICFTVAAYAYLLSFLGVSRIIQRITDRSDDYLKTPLFEYGGILLIFFVFPTLVNMPVCQLLTSILAFHRFLLYFLPNIGDFLSGKKALQYSIRLLYAVVLITIFILWYIPKVNGGSEKSGNFVKVCQFSEWLEYRTNYRFCIGLGLSELLISIPYTFMILSIRKLTELASAIQSRPEKYIAYQIVIAFVFKLISFLAVFFNLYFKKGNLETSVLEFLIIDMMTFPLAVQLAYILSNRKNVDTLIAVITGKVMFWKNRARVEVENSTRF